MTALLIEPFGGIAGDMLLAALCDLGDPRFGIADLERLAAELVPGEAELRLEEARRGAFRGLRLRVRTPESGHAPHRHLSDLLALVDRTSLSPAGRRRAADVFRAIARAESRVHGVPEEEIHFHEVGAVDTLVDVCGAVLALEKLGVARVAATPPLVGGGTVTGAHGEMPVPAPGTAELLRGLPVRHGCSAEGERTTPTGAALLAVLADFEPLAGGRVEAVGYGAGARDFESGPPNLVRVQLLGRLVAAGGGTAGAPAETAAEAPAEATVLELAFQLDDATGEEIAFAIERLREVGALDAWHAPVAMKKGRPGVLVGALVRPGLREEVERVVFEHTTTFGVRWSERSRTECGRTELTVELEGASVRVKRRIRPGVDAADVRAIDLAPEFEDLAALARESGAPLRELARRAVARALEILASGADRGGAGSERS